MNKEGGNNMLKVLKWIGILFAIFIVIGIIGSMGDGGSNNASQPVQSTQTVSQNSQQTQKPAEPAKPDLEIIESKTESDSFTRYIVGTVKNNSKKQYSYVQIEINLYDKSGNQVGSTFDNLNNLEPGATWRFKAIILEDNAASYKIKGVSGF